MVLFGYVMALLLLKVRRRELRRQSVTAKSSRRSVSRVGAITPAKCFTVSVPLAGGCKI